MKYYYPIKKTIKVFIYSLIFFFKIKKNENLLATLPRSGTHLTFGLINICYAMKLGYKGILGTIDNNYSTFAKLQQPFDERSIFKEDSAEVLWHSHLPYSKITPLRKKFCKTIVLIREPVEGVKSFFLHSTVHEGLKFTRKKISLKKFLEIDKKKQFVKHYSEFLDSWYTRKISSKLNQIVIIDNEVIKKNIFFYLKFLNKFFRFNFTTKQMKNAVSELDIRKIKKTLSDRSIRITNQKLFFSEDVEIYIKKKCYKKYLRLSLLAKNKLN